MSDAKAAEPSIEDILASIRKIISDDEPAAEGAVAPRPAAMPPPAPVAEVASAPIAAEPEADPWAEALAEQAADETQDEDDDDVLELTEIVPEPPALEPEPEPVAMEELPAEPPPMPVPAPAFMEDDQPLASPATVHAASDAFARLAHAEPKQPAHHTSSPADGKTVEDLVRELLRPLLREWIDGNLPEMVESLVQKELRKISRRPEDL